MKFAFRAERLPLAAGISLGLFLVSAVSAEVKVTDFGKTSNGTPVKQYTLTNSSGVIVKLLSRGATLAEWHVPDKNGQMADVVFGFDDVAGYESPANGYDHNFALNNQDGDLALAAKVREPKSGRMLSVSTTEPGLQFYGGNFLTGAKGKGGKTYAHRSGLCLETQHYPNAANEPKFASITLAPGETYKQTCVYQITVE